MVRVAVATVGAGPAGLLFASLTRMLAERRGVADALALRVYDKRATYVRTHRLRMAKAAYLEIQREVADPRFDALMAFLEDEDFAPEVNVLEEHLEALLAAVGGEKELLAVGPGEGETSLADLRTRLVREGAVLPGTLFSIVAADSVHSTLREMVRGAVQPLRRTHEQLARLRVVGDALPRRLGAVDQLRLSRVLGSIVDYRLNKNGFAEVDLFLTPGEFARVKDLGATPKEPVRLSSERLATLRTPMFRAIVAHLEAAGGAGGRLEVLLQSTFQLEHAVMPKLTFVAPEVDARVFLVGDAGLSLPFQRGMSCLAHCALRLARIHVELAATPVEAPARVTEALVARYDDEARAVFARELGIVTSRARLVHTLRELVRLSALLPFPIQSWWLRVPGDKARARDHFSLWWWTNFAVAAAAALVAGLGLAARLPPFAWWSVGLEVLGGVLYTSALAFEGGPHRLVRRVWQLQLALVFAVGMGRWAADEWATRRFALDARPFWSLVLAAGFLAGVYAFERAVAGWFARAGLQYRDPS